VTLRWIVDANNVFGSQPDGWWNDRRGAQARFAQRVGEWCRTHGDDVVLVFDAPLDVAAARLAGGNLAIVEAPHHGRDAADDHIVDLADEAICAGERVRVVTSDRGLRRRLDAHVDVLGSAGFLALLDAHTQRAH
jgi:predicted RNA-binding protein with PIN domain